VRPLHRADGTFEDTKILRHRNQQIRHTIMISIENAESSKKCRGIIFHGGGYIITNFRKRHQQQANSTEFENRPLGLVVKRITSITHNAMIRSLVRFWQRAAFFAPNEHVCGVV
jgi:hypothetical protein